MADVILDVVGLNCPIPVMKASKRIKELAVGDVLLIRATDVGAEEDLGVFCETKGHAFLECRRDGEILEIRIQKQG